MKPNGIVRKVDNVGRIGVPQEIRVALNIQAGDALAFFVEGENIILKKCKEPSPSDILETLKASLADKNNREKVLPLIQKLEESLKEN